MSSRTVAGLIFGLTVLAGGTVGCDFSGETPRTLKADFNYAPRAPEIEQVVTFTDESAAPKEEIIRRTWTLDKNANTYSGLVVTHAFQTAGNHEVTLTVTDASGMTDTTSKTVNVVTELSFGSSLP